MTSQHAPLSLDELGWSAFFQDQLEPSEVRLGPRRIARVHRARLTALAPLAGVVDLSLSAHADTSDYCVGDWVLANPGEEVVRRRLSRKTVLERRIHGSDRPQLAAANVDTLFIVTACDGDFNVARLERYLALANQAGTTPVILLTKADTVPDARTYVRQAEALQRALPVRVVDPRCSDVLAVLAAWCGVGQTIALVGSSGVGKSTLVNKLTGAAHDTGQVTGAVRAHDAKGRHTTTSRSIHAIVGGGFVIDTPGMRSLQVSEAAYGIDTLFAEITELAPSCRFRNCTHAHEPGCAVQAAIYSGLLDPARLNRWRKLSLEGRENSPTKTRSRGSNTAAANTSR